MHGEQNKEQAAQVLSFCPSSQFSKPRSLPCSVVCCGRGNSVGLAVSLYFHNRLRGLGPLSILLKQSVTITKFYMAHNTGRRREAGGFFGEIFYWARITLEQARLERKTDPSKPWEALKVRNTILGINNWDGELIQDPLTDCSLERPGCCTKAEGALPHFCIRGCTSTWACGRTVTF